MAKRCKTITYSTCPPTGTCQACKEIVRAECVKYYGEDLDCIEVTSGDTLDEILTTLNDRLCEEVSGLTHIPQACLKLKFSQIIEGGIEENPTYTYSYNLFSCSSSSIPEECEKIYKVFNSEYTEIFEGTLSEFADIINTLTPEDKYYMVEYINCNGITSESPDVPFTVENLEEVGYIIVKSR